MKSRAVAVGFLIVLAACSSSANDSREAVDASFAPAPTLATRVPSTTSPAPTSSVASTPSTSSSTLAPVQLNGIFDDVTRAAIPGPLPVNFALGSAAASKSPLYDNGCHASTAAIDPVVCEFGDLASDIVIVFTGDSHAAQWFGALEVAARTNHWKLISMTKSSCPVADVPTYRRRDALPDGEELLYPECDEFHARAHQRIREMQPDLVIFPILTRYRLVGDGGIRGWSKGLGRSISSIAGPGTKVLVLGETPKTNGEDIPSCLAKYRKDISVCANSRNKAEFPERIELVGAVAAEHSATYVNPVDWFCTPDLCPAQIAGRIVYRDYNHISDQFARYRAPQVAEAIKLALVGPDAS